MALPPALAPLRHKLFRMLWTANVVASLGVWMQNTGAGWLMTTLSPDALTVSLVQAATIIPIFLLALPAGALADIIDKRRLLVATQLWMLCAAALLTALTYAGLTGAWGLLALTFAIGIGSAVNSPAWGSVMAEVVPRADLPQAIALNGVGFNIARAIGPAIAGFLVVAGGAKLTFALNVVSYFAVITVLLSWHRRNRRSSLPREHLPGAMRAGMRFVRHTPAMRAAMLRAAAFFGPAAAPWAMLPLVVREQLHLGAGIYGMLLGLMGVGGVTAGMMLPRVRSRLNRDDTVFCASLLSFAGVAILAVSRHWLPAAFGMALFGIGWVTASSVAQGAAQMAAPPWVRSRSLAIYQLAFNGALVIGTFFWGWLGTRVGLTSALLAAAVTGIVFAGAARRYDLDQGDTATTTAQTQLAPLAPEAVAPELAAELAGARGRVLEMQTYRIDPAQKEAFLSVMADVRDVRGRAGAVIWQLYEDVAHADGWIEVWSMENWTDHLREAGRMSEADHACLARGLAFICGEVAPPSRYIAVPPHRIATSRAAVRERRNVA
jgi:MFS family permease